MYKFSSGSRFEKNITTSSSRTLIFITYVLGCYKCIEFEFCLKY
jgi:hypothetical protein